MFSLEYVGQSSHQHAVFRVKYGQLSGWFSFEEWGFRCCGANLFYGFSYATSLLDSKEKIDALIKFLKVYDSPHSSSYRAKETYFCITDTQKEHLTALIEHPNVRHLDRYLNKAHGPEHMNLYRLSCSGDFNLIPK